MPEVSIIIVCMNRPDLLKGCLDGIKRYTKTSYETLVVAYMFSAENLAKVRQEYPWARFIVNDSLAGFAENNNLALRQAAGRFCFIVNDDTIMREPVIDELLADFGKAPAAAAISPRIVLREGSTQTCGRSPWTAWKFMLHYLHLGTREKYGRWNKPSGLFRTWTLNGACFLARTDAFRQAGWFDETYTFTPEDLALGHKFNEMGYEVWADADMSITHLAGSTAGPMETAIKPTRIRGALIFLSHGRKLRYALLGAYAWIIEALRSLRWFPCDRKDPKSHAAIMYTTARNVMKSVFSGKSTKEIFTELYKEIK